MDALLLGLLLVVVPILIVGVAIVLVVVHFRRGRNNGSRETFANFVGDNLAPPQFSVDVPGAKPMQEPQDSDQGQPRDATP